MKEEKNPPNIGSSGDQRLSKPTNRTRNTKKRKRLAASTSPYFQTSKVSDSCSALERSSSPNCTSISGSRKLESRLEVPEILYLWGTELGNVEDENAICSEKRTSRTKRGLGDDGRKLQQARAMVL